MKNDENEIAENIYKVGFHIFRFTEMWSCLHVLRLQEQELIIHVYKLFCAIHKPTSFLKYMCYSNRM